MAEGKVDENELVKKFEEFCTLAGSKDKTQMTPKANGKMATDCFEKAGYKKYDIKTICDASVFPVCKEKGKPNMTVNKVNVHKYLHKCAHEVAKRKTKNTKIADDDAEVVKIEADLENCIMSGGPQVKVVKQSATGNVGGLTDTSKYTGAHKERFDESGKGKGADGRENRVDNSGYVGNYKGEGTHDKKK